MEDNGIEKQGAAGSRLAKPWEADKASEERLKFLWEVQSMNEMAEELGSNVFTLAAITTRKYALLRRGMLSAFVGGVLGALVLIFR